MKSRRRKPNIAQCYKVGDLVEGKFSGHGIIVDFVWPEQAKILINNGDVVCIPLEKIQIIQNQK